MDELQEYLKLRANIYRLLSKFFYQEPTNAYVDDLKKYTPVFKSLYDNSQIENINAGITELELFYTSFDGSDKTINELECEFAKIFLSINALHGQKSVVPQESVYRSAKGISMQEERDQVLEIYYKEGVGRSKNFKEPEDHISAEMGFVAFMSDATAEHMTNNEEDKATEKLKTQKLFMDEHLTKWAPKVCEDVCSMGSEYYKGVAKLTAGFLEYDSAFLSAMINPE